MLLNNFKGLITWGTDFVFKNVLGNNYAKTDILKYITSNSKNSHVSIGALTYDYTTTTLTNNNIEEQALYGWNEIVHYINNASTEGSNGLVLFVGDSDIEVTQEDYKLGNSVPLTVISATCTHANGITSVIRTFQNTTEQSVTIKEVGLYVFRTGHSTAKDYQRYLVMVGRKVLESPVTIEPNETYTFTYQINMNDFEFKEI